MTSVFAAETTWLVVLDVGLGLLVAAPLLLVLGAVVFEVARRLRSRRKDVRLERLPGIGRIPVLRFQPELPGEVRRRTTDPAR